MTLNYNLQGGQRKRLVHAISEIMGDEAKYLKTPTYAYQVGEYHIDKHGTVTGPQDNELEADLRKLGFEISETPTMDEAEIPSAESEAKPQEGEAHATSATDEAYVQDEADDEDFPRTEREELGLGRKRQEDPQGENGMSADDVPEWYTYRAELSDPETPDRMEVFLAEHDEDAIRQAYEFCTEGVQLLELHELDNDYNELRSVDLINADNDRLTIEMPLDGFDPPKLENLCKMVDAKAPLLVMALEIDNLRIQQTDGKVKFPWFKGGLDGETVNAYATLISKLCETAKKKARITAKVDDGGDNPKFSFRVWLISLGMVGAEFKDVRRILLAKLPGNSAWKAGCKPEKTNTDGNVGEAPASAQEQEATIKSEYEMMMEQLPKGTRILRQYNASENGEHRIITDENGEKRYVVEREENGYPRLIHKP